MSLVSALLFPAPEVSYSLHSFPGELLWIPFDLDYAACKPGDCVPALFLNCPNARYLVLYLHTNGEDLGHCHPFAAALQQVLEVHVLVVEYPGYGLCPGESSEETLWAAADAAFRFIEKVLHWPAEDIIVLGRSLGSALATRLVQQRACHGLILVAPFLSLAEAVGQYIGGSLARALVGDMFSTADHMADIQVPTLVIHGQEDRLVPPSHGRRLFELCPHTRKVFVSPEGMGHNCDLMSSAAMLVRPMLSFFSLPDYNFDELTVPPEAFDKRLCLQYHNIVELSRDAAPMQELLGDQEPCPCHWQCGGLTGPYSQVLPFEGSSGDTDDLSGSMDHTVLSHRGGLLGDGPVRAAAEADVAAGLAAALADALESASTADAPSTPQTRPSESLSGGGLFREDSLASGPPGLDFLNIDNGISRFLRENSAPSIP